MSVVVGGRLVYMGGYSIASESLRACKLCVCETTETAEEEAGMEGGLGKIMNSARTPSVVGHKKRKDRLSRNYPEIGLFLQQFCLDSASFLSSAIKWIKYDTAV